MTADELLAEYQRIAEQSHNGPDGHSRQELQDAWGCCKELASRRIRALVLAGQVEVIPGGVRLDVSGKVQRVPLYRFKGKPCK